VLAASLVGAIALAVAGKWQQGAPRGARGLQLATLTGLSGGYVLANVGGITLTEVGAWRAMYFVGLVCRRRTLRFRCARASERSALSAKRLTPAT